jgi:hypothetical protein
MDYRSDIVNEDLLLKAIRAKERHNNVTIITVKVDSAVAKGENFLGDLASVDLMVKITPDDNQETFKSYKWIIKMLKPTVGFNIGRLLGVFDVELHTYKVCLIISRL